MLESEFVGFDIYAWVGSKSKLDLCCWMLESEFVSF